MHDDDYDDDRTILKICICLWASAAADFCRIFNETWTNKKIMK